MNEPSFFRAYYTAIDGDDPLSVLTWIADDFAFKILYAGDDGEEARHFGGDRAAFRELLASGPTDRSHHLHVCHRTGLVEVASGETRAADGAFLGTFICSARFGPDGRVRRYFLGRSPSLQLGDDV